MFVASFSLSIDTWGSTKFFREPPSDCGFNRRRIVDIGKSALDNWEDLMSFPAVFSRTSGAHPLWIVLIRGMLGMVRRK